MPKLPGAKSVRQESCVHLSCTQGVLWAVTTRSTILGSQEISKGMCDVTQALQVPTRLHNVPSAKPDTTADEIGRKHGQGASQT